MKKGTSHNVWADRYVLKELVSVREGKYNQNGSKELKGSGLYLRSFVEARNLVDNNELYVIDEDKTSELMKIREVNIKKQAEENEKVKESKEDVLANALLKALGKTKPEPVKEVIDFEDLKIIIKDEDLGIRILKDDTREKVESKIAEARSKK